MQLCVCGSINTERKRACGAVIEKWKGRWKLSTEEGVWVRDRFPLQCSGWIPMLCGPDQSAGLLLSFCSSRLPQSSSFLPSLTPSLSYALTDFFSYPALCLICLSAPTLSASLRSSPVTLLSSSALPLLLVTSPFPPAFLPDLWIPSVFLSLLSWLVWGMIHARVITPPPAQPRAFLSLSQLHVRDCVHSVAQLSPNSP